MICTDRNNCKPANSNRFIIKDYPRHYSGEGVPPSGLNPYQDDKNPGRHDHYYSYVRSAVARDGTKPGLYSTKDKGTINYTPVTQIRSTINDDPSEILGYEYEDGRYDINSLNNVYPNKFVDDYYNDYSRFEINPELNFSPRYFNLHPNEIQPLRNYHYYPMTEPQYDHMPYYKELFHKKYATSNYNEDAIKSSEDGVYYKSNVLPYNHVEWKGRVYDCADLPPAEWCTDPIYGSTVHAKCEAQGKYLGRTNGGKCSLDAACIPGATVTNAVECVRDIADADKMGLLTNENVKPAQCHQRYHAKYPNQLDFWRNKGYFPRDLATDYLKNNF